MSSSRKGDDTGGCKTGDGGELGAACESEGSGEASVISDEHSSADCGTHVDLPPIASEGQGLQSAA